MSLSPVGRSSLAGDEVALGAPAPLPCELAALPEVSAASCRVYWLRRAAPSSLCCSAARRRLGPCRRTGPRCSARALACRRVLALLCERRVLPVLVVLTVSQLPVPAHSS